MNYRNKCGYRGISAFLILLMLFIFVSCQTTPDQEAIQNKNDVSKIEFETQVKDDDETLMTGERLICTKEYENGSILSVETIIDNQLSDNAVEVSLEPYSFKNGDEMEEIVQLIYPNQEIYQSMPQRTKEQYQSCNNPNFPQKLSLFFQFPAKSCQTVYKTFTFFLNSP